jgi:hypothetical protein
MRSLIHGQQHAPDFAVLGRMPFRSALELGAFRQAPGNARRHAVNVLRDGGLRHLEESAAPVISGLMTNSVLATGRMGLVCGSRRQGHLGAGARASHRRGIARMKARRRECGFTAEDQLELIDHLLEIFTAANGRDRPGPGSRRMGSRAGPPLRLHRPAAGGPR